jgi:conjugative relaxase-like TrwC/TraI family protein
MLTIRAMSDGAGYSANHLEHNDYYSENERIQGEWFGRGAEMLGLRGEVQNKQFEAVRQGLHPDTGEFLRQRHSADRIANDGTTQSKARTLYDFTVSAPKSVSILAGPGEDGRLVEAHRKAVKEALEELEAHAETRVRQGGANHDRTTGNLVVAAYHHDSSRELDPQLHTHAVAANLTYDGTEGRWKALQASEIYEHRAYLTEVYRNALAREVEQLGYQIENRRDAKGRDLGFEIRGVSQELIEKYSQRSAQRDQAIADFTKSHGRAPTDNEVAVLVRESRSDKLAETSSGEVRARQQARLSLEESRALREVRSQAVENVRPGHELTRPSAPSLEHAKDHIFERVSVAQDHEVMTEALRHGRGHIQLGELRGEMWRQESQGELLRAGREVATRQSLDRETEMVAKVNGGLGTRERLGGDHQFVVSDRLRPEQKQVVESVLNSRDQVVNIQGAAGTGKTTTLEEIHRGIREGGREVLAVAPTMSAVEELQKVGFDNAITIERLLQDQRAQATLHGKVLIVDEAGMVSSRQMSELLKVAEQHSARIVFSGDTRQIQSVEAGDALRVLEKESQLRSVSLTQVQRQSAEEYREAIEDLRVNPDRGFERLESMGSVREVAAAERAQSVAEAYARLREQPNAHGQERSVLVVCATHQEIDRVTEAIRNQRKSAGELGEETTVTRHVALNWTEAQKRDTRNYAPGQVLEFHRGMKNIAKSEVLEVERVEGNKVIARNAQGEQRVVTSRQSDCYSVHEHRSAQVAAKDRLILTANRREPGFRATNGELVTIKSVDQTGRIELADGRKLPGDYRQFDFGYAVTAHRSQGKTVDAVVISADSMKRELFYVSASRGREAIRVVTSDRERLRDSVARSGARQSASELARHAEQVRQQRPGKQQGEHRGREAAREQSHQASRTESFEAARGQQRSHDHSRQVAEGRSQSQTRITPAQPHQHAHSNENKQETSNEPSISL